MWGKTFCLDLKIWHPAVLQHLELQGYLGSQIRRSSCLHIKVPSSTFKVFYVKSKIPNLHDTYVVVFHLSCTSVIIKLSFKVSSYFLPNYYFILYLIFYVLIWNSIFRIFVFVLLRRPFIKETVFHKSFDCPCSYAESLAQDRILVYPFCEPNIVTWRYWGIILRCIPSPHSHHGEFI